MAEDTCNSTTRSPVMKLARSCISTCPCGTTLGMKGHEHHDKAEESATEAHKPLAQGDDQDTAAAWAAVAAWAITDAGPDRREIVPPGVPKPRLPGVGPLPGP
jgi:hypothetical protein